MNPENRISIRTWGDFACFTRPEMKVERVSYPVMTPSAARGVLEAIFWEPQMYYLIDSIRVVRKGHWVSFVRNELKDHLSIRAVQSWMKGGEFEPILGGGGGEDNTQRNTLALREVEYIISAEVRVSSLGRNDQEKVVKYVSEVRRRASQGKCHARPALGLREFTADFEYEEDPAAAHERRLAELRPGLNASLAWPEEDLGLLLYDVFDPGERDSGFRWLRDGEPTPMGEPGRKKKAAPVRHLGKILKPGPIFFRAQIRNSTLDCHPDRVALVRMPGGAGGSACS